MPGTSSAVISNNLGIKTCYDPSNTLNKNENCIWGLTLAKNKKDLEIFFKGLK